jgi:hypothetical protein
LKLEGLGLIFPLSGMVNPKVPMRAVQFINALNAKTYGSIDLTTCRGFLACRDAGYTLNRDAIEYTLTGRVMTTDAPNTKGVSLSMLDKIVGRVGRGTVGTQVSRTWGINGFARALGMVEVTGAVNFTVKVNPDAVFSRRFYTLIDDAKRSQLEEMGPSRD